MFDVYTRLRIGRLACGLHYWAVEPKYGFHFTDKTKAMTMDIAGVLSILANIGLIGTADP